MSWGNFSLIVNSKFQPFSFERYIQPYQMYGEAYREVEDALGELATKANVWEEMANEQTDPYAYKMYKNYANDLENKAGQLAREGLNATSRRDMLNMRTRYSKEITPIEQAYTARQKQAEQQQQALLQDNDLMFSRRAATTSLDDYIRNPQLAYDAYSGKNIIAKAAQAATALAKQIRDNPRKWGSILNDSYYETLMQKGFKTEDVLKAIQGHPEAAQELTRIVEDAVSSSNIRGWNNQELLDRAYDYARQGLWSAVGETQYQTLQNPEYLNPLQRAQLAKLNSTPTDGYDLNPSNIYSTRERSREERAYQDAINKYSNYFYEENGKWKMTKEGWDEYNRKVKTIKGKPYTTPEGTTISTDVESTYINSPFRQFVDSLGVTRQIAPSFNSQISDTIGEAWGKYASEPPEAKTAKYDATKTSEIIYDVPSSEEYQNNFKSKLSRAIGSTGELVEVDYDANSNTWRPTGKTLPLSQFDKKDYKLVSRAPSEIGSTWFIKKDGEKAKRYLAIPGIHTTAEGGRDQAVEEMLLTQRMLLDPNLTQQQKMKLEGHYGKLKQQVVMFESQLDLTNQISTQNFKPYYIP